MTGAREPLPDALRALAMIGVLLVNGLGYADAPYGRLLGTLQPPESAGAAAALAVVAAFVQGKAYPLLALLFGMGLAFAARGRPAPDAVRAAHRRSRRLLLLGVLHGVFLYFGDILTLYALCAFWVAAQMRERGRQFLGRLRSALGWALVAVVSAVAIALVPLPEPLGAATLGSVGGYSEFVAVNAETYIAGQVFGLLLALPLVRLSMLIGVAAVRWRLLTHRRWQAPWRAVLRRAGVPLLALNLAYGMAYATLPDDGQSVLLRMLESAAPLWAVPLSVLYAGWAASYWRAGRRGWAGALAPLGRHTLTVYVTSSALMLLAASGAGAGWQPGTVGWIGIGLLLWLAAVVASHVLPGRWPLEAWMARR